MKPIEEARALVIKAFQQAKKKKGVQSTTMSIAVLNNRLLQITKREFDPREFGAQDLRSLISRLSPEVRLTSDLFVELITTQLPIERGDGPSITTATLSPKAIGSSGRIRQDLWLSIVDYASGSTYVWDEQQGRARVASPDDRQPKLPTLTPPELAKWRQAFIEEHRPSLSGAELANALRWQEQGLSTVQLPTHLQSPWNREITFRVRQRLHSFFSMSMVTTLQAADTPLTGEAKSPLQILDEELAAARDKGDNFGIGELLARSLTLKNGDPHDRILAGMICAWGLSRGPVHRATNLSDVVSVLGAISTQNFATALINSLRRLNVAGIFFPEGASDIAYRLRDEISSIYGIDSRRSPLEICRLAIAQLETGMAEIEGVVSRFLRTTAATAKSVSIEILKVANRLSPMLVASERQFLRDVEILVGPAFRKLCEAYQRNDDAEVIRRAPEFLENVAMQRPPVGDPRPRSTIWIGVIQPITEHLTAIVEEATSRGAEALAPNLRLRNPSTKADLRGADKSIFLSFSLRNQGRGHAYDVSLQPVADSPAARPSLAEPTGPFDIPPGSEQLVRVRVLVNCSDADLSIPIQWVCQTAIGRPAVFSEILLISQQVTEPNWDALIANPPYSLNPVKQPERLYGRESSLRKLRLAAMSGASTFVWGQKRIGKTSLLQVLAAELTQRPDTSCILLRMGEIASLHEGQLARLMAKRLIEHGSVDINIPAESDFGSGLGRLIPFVELLASRAPNRKFVVIIDEFDDLDSAFYMGERGKQFVKALRSISEIGITFFFVGSERMEAIYSRHQADLNKWTNVQLDRIDSRADCRSLIETPVSGVIEFSPEAIDFITDYTSGNPFYIHNFCYQVFDRCLQEHRTFVDDNDTQAVRQQLLRALGPTNFAHFWEDNPVLEPMEKRKALAENCVVLTCIAVLGGRYEAAEDLQETQESLPISAEDRAAMTDMRRTCERLVSRKVLVSRAPEAGFVIGLQVFREWLGENAVSKLLPNWTEYRAYVRANQVAAGVKPVPVDPDNVVFPIAEDDMIAVAQRLLYCGRQKDVAEIRSWLRQFDDDGRMEIAFQLLKRLADRGFINEGMRARSLQKLAEMTNSKRLDIGGKSWRIVNGRLDNLCVGYVDSEHKSGAATARELQKLMRPGKCAAASDLGSWMRSHAEEDAMVVIVDDFAGTGDTISKGVKKFKNSVAPEVWARFADSGRISIYLMYAFPEALEQLRQSFPEVDAVAATTFGDELRACDDGSDLFAGESERRFATEILTQIGRELYPAAPLGYGGLASLVIFHNSAPNNTLPIFWNNGMVGEQPWKPLFPRA